MPTYHTEVTRNNTDIMYITISVLDRIDFKCGPDLTSMPIRVQIFTSQKVEFLNEKYTLSPGRY
jgi:hypothetical protein